MPNTTFSSLSPTAMLCVAAHADDIEAYMGGTVAKYAAAGTKVYYLILTDGAKGGSEPDIEHVPKQRQAEQRAAARELGVHEVAFTNYGDCTLAASDTLKRDIVRAIREIKPEVVMCLDPTMMYSLTWGMINHADHRAAGEATLDAVYPLACNHASFPELATEESLPPHRVSTVLMVNCDTQNFYVDVTDHMEQKRRSLSAHASQTDSLQEVFRLVESTASRMGKEVGTQYAEGFIRLDVKL